MSKTFTYDRYDVRTSCDGDKWDEENNDGQYVLAEDAINREAVLQAQIRTLETQLKDARAFARLTRDAALEEAAGIAEAGVIFTTTTGQLIAKAIRQKKEAA